MHSGHNLYLNFLSYHPSPFQSTLIEDCIRSWDRPNSCGNYGSQILTITLGSIALFFNL
eukprot:c47391_g1_i1 orf=3-176(-)